MTKILQLQKNTVLTLLAEGPFIFLGFEFGDTKVVGAGDTEGKKRAHVVVCSALVVFFAGRDTFTICHDWSKVPPLVLYRVT